MTTPNDKFKIIETAPEFAIGSTGSYSSTSLKILNIFKSRNPLTGSTIITSGILGSNLNTIPTTTPPEEIAPPPEEIPPEEIAPPIAPPPEEIPPEEIAPPPVEIAPE